MMWTALNTARKTESAASRINDATNAKFQSPGSRNGPVLWVPDPTVHVLFLMHHRREIKAPSGGRILWLLCLSRFFNAETDLLSVRRLGTAPD